MKKILILICALTMIQCTKEVAEINDTAIPQTRSAVEIGDDYQIDTTIITVKLRQGAKMLRSDIRVQNNNQLGYIDVRVPAEVDFEEYFLKLLNSEEFESVEYNTIGEYFLKINDDHWDAWHLSSVGMPSAWNITTGSSSVKVAVIDSGVKWTHPDLGSVSSGGNIDASSGWNYLLGSFNTSMTNFDHGTLVTGVIAARTNNGYGVAGIAGGNNSRGVTIIPYCVGDGNGVRNAYIDDAILDAVAKGARVISMSIGGFGRTTAIDSAIGYALSHNVVIVAATGNANADVVSYPASIDGVIAVGGIDTDGKRWFDSNYGTALDVVAPSSGVWTTTLNGSYMPFSGTSFAAPIVAGVAALILSKWPLLSATEVRNAIERTANRIGKNVDYDYVYNKENGRWDTEMGYGLVDAYAALSSIGPLTSGGQISLYSNTPVNAGSVPGPINGDFPTGGSGTNTYSWEMSTDLVSWTVISGATGSSYHYQYPIGQTTHFRRKVTSGGQTAYSNVVTILVNGATLYGGVIEYGGSGGDYYYLYNKTAPTGGGGAPHTYQWQYSTNQSSWSGLFDSNSVSYSYQASPYDNQTLYFRRKVTAGGQTAYSNIVQVAIGGY